MIDEEEDTGGKIDWTIAIVLSVAFHAAILGAVWFFSDHPGDAKAVDEGKTEEVAKTTEPDAPDGGEASGRSDEDESEGPEVATTATTAERPTTPAARPTTTRQTARPTTTATSADRPTPVVGEAPAGAPRTGTYEVKRGDFLSRIANKCGCTVAELKELNGIKDADNIHPGQKLKVPVKE